jgi:hypothetical protein
MAFQLDYTNEQNINMPKTYWKITRFEVDVSSKRANFNFTGYKDKASKDANFQPIGNRSYNISGEEFETYYAKVIGKELNPAEVFYKVAKTRTDKQDGFTQKEVTREVKRVIDEPSDDPDVMVQRVETEIITEMVNDKPINVSFFNGALDV